MDEPKDPAPGRGRPLVAANTGLTPVQEAYSAWTGHRLRCHTCRDLDAGACELAEQLWRAYDALSDAAFRRVRTA